MPRKKKKKKEPPLFEFDLLFSDPTMVEGEGEFLKVKDLMENSIDSFIQVISGGKVKKIATRLSANPSDWHVRTRLTIVSPMGEGNFLLNLSNDGNVFIVEYHGNTADPFYNADIRCLTRWCQVSGWKIPQPAPSLVQEALVFWKQMWETLLIDSEYLDTRFGLRKSLDMRSYAKQENENEEDF